jgi:integrase
VVRAHPTVPLQKIPLWFQQRTDRPDVFARAKYKRRIQMALRMVALVRAKDGSWFARKGIPEDVRDPYARLFGVRREALLRLPKDTRHHEAKTRCAEWIAEVETRIATLRAERSGEGQPLTTRNAVALAGQWYTWFVGQHENEPGSPKQWKRMSDHLVWDVIYPEAPESYLKNPGADPHWEWQKRSEVREAVRPQVAELARVATFLASEGKTLNATAYALFVDAVSDNLLLAITLLERRANGDYSPDETPESFPAFTEGPIRASGVSCWDLFGAFVKATKPADTTVSRWRAVFLEMQREFAEVGAEGITEDKARAWVFGLISDERSALTVREIWLSASRRVFGWAREQKRIRQNPFAEIKVDVPRKVQTREDGKAFTDDELRIILNASLQYSKPTTPTERARRWVPWLCAYSGARPGEMTQLRGSDVEARGDMYVMKITPEAGKVKNRTIRVVPLHEHIIAQGFIEMVKQVGKGALFYNDATPQRVSGDPLKPARSRADTTRAHLGTWVRSLGITDPALSPNHSWRHTFKRIAEAVGITEKVHDAITGHTPATEGRKYGPPSVADMAKALKKFPRYRLSDASSVRRKKRT